MNVTLIYTLIQKECSCDKGMNSHQATISRLSKNMIKVNEKWKDGIAKIVMARLHG